MHSIESRCDIGPEDRLFLQGCPCTFSPEILQVGTVKGLTKSCFQRGTGGDRDPRSPPVPGD